jgi:hypothetical protein
MHGKIKSGIASESGRDSDKGLWILKTQVAAL